MSTRKSVPRAASLATMGSESVLKMAKKKTSPSDSPAGPMKVPATRRRTPPPRAAAADRPATAAAPEQASQDPTYEQIAEAAYRRYLSRGGSHGRDFDDWLEAERELRSRR